MKVIFDTNVILDEVLARVPFVENAAYLLESVELGKIQGFISATTVTYIHYLVRACLRSQHPRYFQLKSMFSPPKSPNSGGL